MKKLIALALLTLSWNLAQAADDMIGRPVQCTSHSLVVRMWEVSDQLDANRNPIGLRLRVDVISDRTYSSAYGSLIMAPVINTDTGIGEAIKSRDALRAHLRFKGAFGTSKFMAKDRFAVLDPQERSIAIMNGQGTTEIKEYLNPDCAIF